jgi:hypothetical protein
MLPDLLAEKEYIEKQSRRGERIAVISRFSSGANGNSKAPTINGEGKTFLHS